MSVMETALKHQRYLLKLDLAREKRKRRYAEYNYASKMLEVAALEEFLAERASKTGIDQMPLNAEAAKRFFEGDV